MIHVSIYDGSEHPALSPYATKEFADMKSARAWAAKMLGHKTLRGASTWDRYQGGSVYQFGPRDEDNNYDHAVIEDDRDSSE